MASFLDQLRELRDLKADGTITEAEFNTLKKRIILPTAPISASAPSPAASSAVDLSSPVRTKTSVPPLRPRPDTSRTSGKNEMVVNSAQATLHKYFGPSKLTSSSGVIFQRTDCPLTTKGRFVCDICSKPCQTNQALISHCKTHTTASASTGQLAQTTN
jgi:hypothetical protein